MHRRLGLLPEIRSPRSPRLGVEGCRAAKAVLAGVWNGVGGGRRLQGVLRMTSSSRQCGTSGREVLRARALTWCCDMGVGCRAFATKILNATLVRFAERFVMLKF